MLTTIESLPILQVPLFSQESWFVHGFGIRDIAIEKYLKTFGLSNPVIPETRQVHSNKVHILKKNAKLLEGDAFVTDLPNSVCWVRSADCLPILLADTKQRVVGAIHAGWRGTANQVLSQTLEMMTKEWGSKVSDLKVALGPAICGRCYEVGFDVVEAFKKAGLFPGPWIEESTRGKWHLDIAFANFYWLERAGIPRENIYLSLACTACDLKKFSSYRREGDKRGEQVSFIVIR